MTLHLSARVAWHMDGWNGRICHNPAANTYCVGQYSYPGTMILERRDLEWEHEQRGRCCSELEAIPPCIYSINAFGTKPLTAFADPPEFFNDNTRQRRWGLPPATVCIWPYEEMYTDDVKIGRSFDNDARRQKARAYFDQVEPNRSLIIYYANYSNPFNQQEERRYVIVGISRVKAIGEELFYENCSRETKQKFGGGFVWQRNVSSHYPDQGLRLPYHLYQEQPEILEQILFNPENARNFKFGTRLISDDDTLSIVERFLEIAGTLRDLGDTSEDWNQRIEWLQSLIAELWQCRGLYPGLPKVLDHIGFETAIPYFKAEVERGHERAAYERVVAYLDGSAADVPGLPIDAERGRKVRRQWQLREDDERKLLRDILPRFDLRIDQIARILAPERAGVGIYTSLDQIAVNPYLLSEQFIGDGPDDTISFTKIDHGMFPSPELGEAQLADRDDWRRLRALCVERLAREEKHSFMAADLLIHEINRRLSYFPEWKRHQFSERYLSVDEAELAGALTFRKHSGRTYVYLRSVYEDERLIEQELRALANRPDISFRSPVTAKHWQSYLHDPRSPIAQTNPQTYDEIIAGQSAVCQQVFTRPICVISGAAGTGKTTIIRALIRAIEKAHGAGTSFKLLAPTGKAADRIRETTREEGANARDTATIHSFLAQKGWLNDNFTFKRSGGQREENVTTYIIDESSMLDLALTATLFRAINWSTVQRLIFVGDPNQLPPIGRGRVFADCIDWLEAHMPESVGRLTINVRQMENRIADKGIGILDLASIYVRTSQSDQKDSDEKHRVEAILSRVQEGGDVDKDLRVIYWREPEDLADALIQTMIADMEADTGQPFNPDRASELWRAAWQGENGQQRPEYHQVISPYRGEQFGTDSLNAYLQEHINGWLLNGTEIRAGIGHLGGITLFDKVIQYRNRTRSNPLWAYNFETRTTEPVEVYNGELGFVKPHAFDGAKWKSPDYFRFQHFQVVFSRKQGKWVGYGKDLGKNDRGRFLAEEKVEDNLELAYAISVHKAQGSEFDRVYFIVPKHKQALLSRELFYTGITRARRHCTIFVQEDIAPLLSMRRVERSHLLAINSSLFVFRPVADALINLGGWYEEGKIHRTLADVMVRSKSEVIIANMLFERDIPFRYEQPLFASDGTFCLPDFTITARGEQWYWEHLGRLDDEKYRNHWETKQAWYNQFFPGRLLVTTESGQLSHDAQALITTILG